MWSSINIQKSLTLTHPSNKQKEKLHEQLNRWKEASDKNQHSFQIETVSEQDRRGCPWGNNLYPQKPTEWMLLSKTRIIPFFIISIQHWNEGPSHFNKARKRNKRLTYWNEEIKACWPIWSEKSVKNSYSMFSKVTGCKKNI